MLAEKGAVKTGKRSQKNRNSSDSNNQQAEQDVKEKQ